MGKRVKKIGSQARKSKELLISIVIMVATVFIALTVVFLVYPDVLHTIADAFQGFQDWFLGLFGL